MVAADARRLAQLFGNLLENAVRYTDAGGTLRVHARCEGETAVVEFCDSAPGVSLEHLPRLFDRFYRVEASRNRASGGAGLGLAISRRIVEAHHGEISAQASALGGLCLVMRFPRLIASPAQRKDGA
ncbi:histidine kinase [Acidovorax delafieldii 2AN]|uniref:histidine kinase n=1 Tax=Acidovorax delafieldii 2AN TaxID=573060 RepID=C5T8E9_ACIDE|nr:histidine kinase [Acidovorax delafieldii 2AN]